MSVVTKLTSERTRQCDPRERTDAEAETPILWSPDEKNSLIAKDPDAGKE